MVLQFIKNILLKIPANSITFNVLSKRYYANPNELIINWYYIVSQTLDVKILTIQKNVYKLHTIIIEQATKESINFFAFYILKDYWLNWHHFEWESYIQKKQGVSILASRDIGKTWYFVVLTSIYRMYCLDGIFYKKNSGVIYSETQALSNRKLKDIQNIIELNPVLKNRLYPDSSNGQWAKERIITKNGYDLSCFGFENATRGIHVYHVYCDDVISESALYSKDYREKNIYTFTSVIMPIVKWMDGGSLILVNTPRHKDDLTGFIKKEMRDVFIHREYPAIMPDGRLLWAKKLNWSYLGMMRKAGETYFNQEFMCKPVSDAMSLFPYSMLNISLDESFSYVNSIEEFEHWKTLQYVISGFDFAKSAAVGADFTAGITAGITRNGHFFILNLLHEKGLSFDVQISKIGLIEYYFTPNYIILENNSFQKIYEESYKAKQLQNNNYNESITKVHGITTGREKNDYKVGVPALQIPFERGLIHMPYKTNDDKKITDLILAQFNSITFTDKGLKAASGHDDIVFAFWKMTQGYQIALGSFDFSVIDLNIISDNKNVYENIINH